MCAFMARAGEIVFLLIQIMIFDHFLKNSVFRKNQAARLAEEANLLKTHIIEMKYRLLNSKLLVVRLVKAYSSISLFSRDANLYHSMISNFFSQS
jgi:hypothetical protein